MAFVGIAVRHPEIGSKRLCLSCNTRFYDLTRSPPVCPHCGAILAPEVPRMGPSRRPNDTRRSPRQFAHVEAEEPAPAAETAEDEADEDAEDAEETEIDEDLDDEVPGIESVAD